MWPAGEPFFPLTYHPPPAVRVLPGNLFPRGGGGCGSIALCATSCVPATPSPRRSRPCGGTRPRLGRAWRCLGRCCLVPAHLGTGPVTQPGWCCCRWGPAHFWHSLGRRRAGWCSASPRAGARHAGHPLDHGPATAPPAHRQPDDAVPEVLRVSRQLGCGKGPERGGGDRARRRADRRGGLDGRRGCLLYHRAAPVHVHRRCSAAWLDTHARGGVGSTRGSCPPAGRRHAAAAGTPKSPQSRSGCARSCRAHVSRRRRHSDLPVHGGGAAFPRLGRPKRP